MTDKTVLTMLWDSLNANSISSSKKLFESNLDSLLEFLIDRTLEKEKYEIWLFQEGKQSGSALTFSDKDNKKEIELRLKNNSIYELLVAIEGENEAFLFKNKLSDTEVNLIPENIRKLMYSVKEIARPMTFYNA